MIKNIVFDMGNVLVAYDGRKVCKHYIKDKKDRKCVFTAIFQSPEVDSFDGILFSAEEKLLKPQKEIYERLFEKFNIKPEECYFIDDLQLNIDGAAACGMKGYCFADGNVEKLQKALDKLNEDTK